MVDFLALSLSHVLLAFAIWQLLRRGDLDVETAERRPRADNPARSPLNRPGQRSKPGKLGKLSKLGKSGRPGAPASGREPVRRSVVWPGSRSTDESGAAESDA